MSVVSDHRQVRAVSAPSHTHIRVSRCYALSPERVFDAWLDPQIAGLWLFATASRPLAVASIDARVGGAFRFAARPDRGAIHTGRYIEMIRPKRLVFMLADESRLHQPARVNVEITPLDTGCEVTLVHENVALDAADSIAGRWDGMLYGLAAILDQH